jgi:hypothetical protein
MIKLAALLSLLPALALSAGAHALAPPPEADEPEVIELYNAIHERADQLAEAFAPDEETCPNEVRTAPLVLPVTQSDRLVGYAFVTPRFCLERGVNRFQFDNRMHFAVDGMVRAGHRTPLTLDAEQSLVGAQTTQALLTAAVQVFGENRVERLDLLGSDIRYLR